MKSQQSNKEGKMFLSNNEKEINKRKERKQNACGCYIQIRIVRPKSHLTIIVPMYMCIDILVLLDICGKECYKDLGKSSLSKSKSNNQWMSKC